MTALINGFSLLKLPLLAFIFPEFKEFTDEKCVVRVRLGYRTKNHLRVMYFGALAMGAELSIAASAVDAIQKSGKRIDFIFKDFNAQFLKRADGHVLFVCDQAQDVRDLIDQAIAKQDRLEKTFSGFAHVEGKSEKVMTYQLTLSVKSRGD